jgi:hypothetical protein
MPIEAFIMTIWKVLVVQVSYFKICNAANILPILQDQQSFA